MSKHKAELHKEVSAIFDGVPFLEDNGAQQSLGARVPERNGYIPPEPPAPSYMTATKPKPQQSGQSPPKAAAAKRAKSNTAIKAFSQIPWRQTLEKIKNKLFAPKPGIGTTRQKTMMLLVPFLFIIFVFVSLRVFNVHWPKTTDAEGLIQESFQPVGGSDNRIDWEIPAPYPKTLRDPMQFGSAKVQMYGGGLIIKGIVYSEDNPSAIIGSQIVHEGDEVSGATVIRINKNSVEFEMNGKKWTQKVQR
jgi:hypothetical protein